LTPISRPQQPGVVVGAGNRQYRNPPGALQRAELPARARTQIRKRRYMESHLGTLAEQASIRGKPLALMMLDIDFFKSINEEHRGAMRLETLS
jgi:PleD family two-component response regulator